MNRKELFDRAKAKRKEEKKKEEQGGYTASYVDIQWSALSLSKYRTVRLLGNPYHMREGDRTSPKLISLANIVGDNDKKFRCIFPLKSENENWIMWRIINKVLSYTYDKESESKIYHKKESHPSVFNIVFKNGNADNTYDKGWRPSQVVIANVIDREMMDWHEKNKHTVLLSKKVSEMSNGGMYYTVGFPLMLYNQIFDNIVEWAGDWHYYDVAIRKFKDEPYYKVYHAEEDYKKFIEDLKDRDQTLDKELASRELTEEELSWERYDIDELFPVTSYQKLYNRLKLKIAQIDEALNTNYLEELKDLAEKEKADRKQKEEAKKETEEEKEEVKETTPDPEPEEEKLTEKEKEVFEVEDHNIEEKEEKKEEVKERPKRRAAVEEKKEESLEDKFPLIKKLSEEQKSLITGFDEEKGTLTYSEDAKPLYKCVKSEEGCKMQSPEAFDFCPGCGVEF
jgi:hypothetical protein